MKRKESGCQLRSERPRTKKGKMRFRVRLGHQIVKAKLLRTEKSPEGAGEPEG